MSELVVAPALSVEMPDVRNPAIMVNWIAQGERIGDDILVIRGAIPFGKDLAKVAEVLGVWSASTVVDGGAPAYLQPEHRTSMSCVIGRVEALRPFVRNLTSLEGGLAMFYARNVNGHARAPQAMPWEILRYVPGTFFKEHIDTTYGDPILVQRMVAVVAFCNDDFEGGELIFPRQKVTIKPEAGMVVMFPATFTHPHEVAKVTRGTRYSLVTWFGHFLPTSP